MLQVPQTPNFRNLVSTNAISSPELHRTAFNTSSEKITESVRQIRQLSHIPSETRCTYTSLPDLSQTTSSESAPEFVSWIRYLLHAASNTTTRCPTVDTIARYFARKPK